MSFSDPLEQFAVEMSSFSSNYFQPMYLSIYLPVSKHMFFTLILVIFLMFSVKQIFFSNKLQKIILMLFNFVTSMMKDSMSMKKYSFVLLFFVLFLFIFLSNILGMIPYSMTITSHLMMTLYFSLAFFMGNNLMGICYHKEKFFVLFLPEGVPVMVMPFLILIEYVSYISSIFSLAIRLFANMLSGHILLKILICFIWAILVSNLIHWFWMLLPLSMVFTVMGLETVISFLQAYVFLVLISIYFNDVVNTH